MKRTTRKAKPGHVFVTVQVPKEHLGIARAIAAAVTAADAEPREERPWTIADVLSGALIEGLIEDEKCWLGTSSLDYLARSWDSRVFPRTTAPMLALVKSVSRA